MPVNLFTTNIPLKGQSLGFTQPLVLGNFANYKENMEVNHELINGADFGKHKFLTLTNQAAAPVTGATESGFYATAVSGRMVNFLQRESNLAELGITIYPLGSIINSFATAQALIDTTSLLDATHKIFFGFLEGHTKVDGSVNFLAVVKVINTDAGITCFVNSISQAGSTTISFPSSLTFNPIITVQSTPALSPVTEIYFSLTPFYIPLI